MFRISRIPKPPGGGRLTALSVPGLSRREAVHCPRPIATPPLSGRAAPGGYLASPSIDAVGRGVEAGEAVICHVFCQKNWPVLLSELYGKNDEKRVLYDTIRGRARR